jgi:hypothetical protein
MKLLMISGDTVLAQGREGAFHQMLARFALHWERIDVICPRVPSAEPSRVHGNVYVHPSPHHKALQLLHILRTGRKLLTRYRHDLIASHDYGFFCNGMGAWRLSYRSRVPYVSEILHIEGYPRSVAAALAVSSARAALHSMGESTRGGHPGDEPRRDTRSAAQAGCSPA